MQIPRQPNSSVPLVMRFDTKYTAMPPAAAPAVSPAAGTPVASVSAMAGMTEMVAVAMGLITPGPVVITAGFIGYLVAGFPGAVTATVAIFTPIYLAVVIPGRWFIRHRDNKQVKAFVAGATAAAAGALAGAVVLLTREAVTDWTTAAIGIVSLGLLWRFKINEPYIVIAAGILGVLLHR